MNQLFPLLPLRDIVVFPGQVVSLFVGRQKSVSALDSLPSSKQVAFAERLARIKRRAVPDECFRDKGLMSKWIDGNR